MAKRFGRNQRRRMREQMATLELDRDRWIRSYKMESELRGKISEEHRKLKHLVDDWDRDARSMLGSYSAFLINTGKIESSRLDHLGRMPLPSRPQLMQGPAALEDVAMDAYTTVDLLRLVVDCDFDAMNLRQLIRVRQVDRYGRDALYLAYQLDKRTLHSIGQRDSLWLAQKLASQFQEAAWREVST